MVLGAPDTKGIVGEVKRTKVKGRHAVYIGTAGWSVPKSHSEDVPVEGTHLERYARTLRCVEINSTFYRPHREKTFSRWAAATPEGFRFAVKMAKTVTHEAKLRNCGAQLATFFAPLSQLGEKLGPVLVQLPPKLVFDAGESREFFGTLRELHAGRVVLEPRHASWFSGEAEQLLREFEVARAMADPPGGSSLAATPGGWPGMRYYRLHGAPRKYWSQYEEPFLRKLAHTIERDQGAGETWVIFDNTAHNHAFGDALTLQRLSGHVGR
ncbi:DUF72 domain-containing protein [soil metagenome]